MPEGVFWVRFVCCPWERFCSVGVVPILYARGWRLEAGSFVDGVHGRAGFDLNQMYREKTC